MLPLDNFRSLETGVEVLAGGVGVVASFLIVLALLFDLYIYLLIVSVFCILLLVYFADNIVLKGLLVV